jgi:hypothetical protein
MLEIGTGFQCRTASQMGGAMSIATESAPPFIGPRPFGADDRNLFFGRRREAYEISSLLIARKLVLLYGESGAGKTSLFNAGVRPLIEDDMDILPIGRFQLRTGSGYSGFGNVYTQAVLSGWADSAESGQLTQATLADYLADHPPRRDEEIGLPSPRLLVFDQFEELFTTRPDQWPQRREFLEQLAKASDADPDLRVLIIMREDFLARLLTFAGMLPGNLKDRYFLEPLRQPAAEMAISDPVIGAGRSFAQGAVEDLVRQLMMTRVDTGDEHPMNVKGEFVEPILLQVVCQRLWTSLPPDVTTITQAHLKRYADVSSSLADFYSDAVRQAAAASGVTERAIREWVGEKLLTHPGGTRGTVYIGATSTNGLTNEAVAVLDGRILRTEFRAGARWLEITHDSLLAPIEQSNAAFFGPPRQLGDVVGRTGRNVIVLLTLSVAGAIILARIFHLDVPATVLTLLLGGGAPASMYMTWRQTAKADAYTSADSDPGQLAAASGLEKLAATVLRQWDREYDDRTFNDPTPQFRDIRASWSAADASLTVDWSTLIDLAPGSPEDADRDGLRWAVSARGLSGLDEGDLRAVLEKVPTGWLVVLGGPGAGKSMLMIRTVREIIMQRGRGDPVPVFVPMASWNPEADSLLAWLENQLVIEYPGLGASVPGGDKGTTLLAMLLDEQKIIPILDGLDELPATARVEAINGLNRAFSAEPRPLRLVVTCRTAKGAHVPIRWLPRPLLSCTPLTPTRCGSTWLGAVEMRAGPKWRSRSGRAVCWRRR